MDYVRSPINYTGNKYRLLKDILCFFPKDINTFIDVFGGSGSVILNVDSKHKIYNEFDGNIYGIVKEFKNKNCEEILSFIQNRIEKYSLTEKDLVKFKNNYLLYREYINKEVNEENRFLDLLTIHYFSFNNLIRLSSKNNFNVPFEHRYFNIEKHKKNIQYTCNNFKKIKILNWDYRDLEYSLFKRDDFVYFDPPYYLSNANYSKDWDYNKEIDLYYICEFLTEKEVKWAMSNMLFNKGKEHIMLREWCEKNNYKIHNIKVKYNGWTGTRKDRYYTNTQEVLITNY